MKIVFLKLIVSSFFLFIGPTFAQVDKWNTYQWNSKKTSPWFEWWYYKIVLPETKQSFFFVYGVVNPWDKTEKMKGTRSYVGMGDFEKKIQVEQKFSVEEFSASSQETYVEIQNNIATDKFLKGELINEQGDHYKWNIKVEKRWSFNAEGWMMGQLITDIEWYPAQADAVCNGSIWRNDEHITISKAPCYQDRNWGSQFPDWWAWIVSNQFENHPNTVLAIGGGKPHIRGIQTPFSSMSIGLKHENRNYTFRPIDLQYVRADISFGKWKIVAQDLNYKIEVIATAPKESFMDLQFMTPQGEIFHDYETLLGNVKVKMYKRVGLNYVSYFHVESFFAGIEFGSAKTHSLFRSQLLKSKNKTSTIDIENSEFPLVLYEKL